MLLNLFASCLFACAVGVGSTSNDSPYLNEKKYVSYSDESYQIVLTGNELVYQYTNLASYFKNHADITAFVSTNLEYEYSGNESLLTFVYYDNDEEYINYSDENEGTTQICFAYNVDGIETFDGHFYYFDGDNTHNLLYDSESTLTWILNATTYSAIKQAIELDIQANTEPDYSQFATDAIDLLVGSIGGIATGIGTGLSSLISYLAISGTSMSPFMAVVFVLGGIALAFGLSRWVVNLLTSLGQRNR